MITNQHQMSRHDGAGRARFGVCRVEAPDADKAQGDRHVPAVTVVAGEFSRIAARAGLVATGLDPALVETIRKSLAYEPLTGVFTWVAPLSVRQRPGQRAGSLNRRGYREVLVRRKHLQEHRLAWLFMTGEWPAGFMVDHINRDRADNRFANLRLVSRYENAWNTVSRTELPKGVWKRPDGQFGVQISAHGIKYYLGSYATSNEARAAYIGAAVVLRGEFGGEDR